MTSPASLLDLLREGLAGAPPDVLAAWFFGSVARGEARGATDFDVGVLLVAVPPPTLDGLGLE